MRSGSEEKLPYSLSRWTDVPGSPDKWAWFMEALSAGKMTAFDPRDALPYEWSLRPEDTLGLVFWTKSPMALATNLARLKAYDVKVHVTATDWFEVEHGAPQTIEMLMWLRGLAGRLGHANVTWRFSPVPLVDDVVERFERMARMLKGAVGRVYISFLQDNDKIRETRDRGERLKLMARLADAARGHGVSVLLCNEDDTLSGVTGLPPNLSSGVCAPAMTAGQPCEACGCALMVDPFTINESCALACEYCYVSDKSLAGRKRNTTRRLPLLPVKP